MDAGGQELVRGRERRRVLRADVRVVWVGAREGRATLPVAGFFLKTRRGDIGQNGRDDAVTWNLPPQRSYGDSAASGSLRRARFRGLFRRSRDRLAEPLESFSRPGVRSRSPRGFGKNTSAWRAHS